MKPVYYFTRAGKKAWTFKYGVGKLVGYVRWDEDRIPWFAPEPGVPTNLHPQSNDFFTSWFDIISNQ